MEQLLIAFVQRVEWAQELLKENCGERKALWCARRRIPLHERRTALRTPNERNNNTEKTLICFGR